MTHPSFPDLYAELDAIPGWYGREAAALNDFFLGRSRQSELGMGGDMLEIGVFQGRSAQHLARHLAADESLTLVDVIDSLPATAERLRAATGATIHAHRIWSQLITPAMVPDRSTRFVRIDAMHTRIAVLRDLDTADRTLTEAGIVNLDDMFHVGMAGVTIATIEWLVRHPGRFEMLLTGFGQAWLCRPSFVPYYMDEMRWLPDFLRGWGVNNFSFVRQSGASDCITVGIHHRIHDRDWLMHETDYGNPEGPSGRRLEF